MDNKVVFVNEEEKKRQKLALRKEIIHEIVEDSHCRNCTKFKKHIKKHNIIINK